MNLEIEVSDFNQNGKTVKLTGEVDVYTAQELKDTLLPLTEEEDQFLQVDFSNVTYMDSTGLGVFISTLKSCQQYQNQMELIHVNERILRLFKITGLDEIMNVQSADRGETNHGTI